MPPVICDNEFSIEEWKRKKRQLHTMKVGEELSLKNSFNVINHMRDDGR